MQPLTPVSIKAKNKDERHGEFLFEHKNAPDATEGNGVARVRVKLERGNKHQPDGWAYFDVGMVALKAEGESPYVAVKPGTWSQNTTCERDGFVRHEVIGKRPDSTEFLYRCETCSAVKTLKH